MFKNVILSGGGGGLLYFEFQKIYPRIFGENYR